MIQNRQRFSKVGPFFSKLMLGGVLVAQFLVGPAHAGLFDLGKEESKKPETSSAFSAPIQRPDSFAELAENLLPAVVNISSTVKMDEPEGVENIVPQFPEGSPFEDFFKHFQQPMPHGQVPSNSLGSGFVIDAEKGYVVTNNHVIKGAEEIRVILQNDETIKAEIVGRDEKTDLAVLKIDPKAHKLKAVSFGNSDTMRVGDWVLAIGNPFGLGGTVTAGIISARARDINSGPYDDYLQTDASINRGNSGGPMFNLDGQVIGINTAIFSPTGGSVGIGFAIPSSQANVVIDQLIEYGHTRRGWLGVRIQSVTDEIAESLGMDHASGALIASVNEEGPAHAAGIKAGDIILKFNGQIVEEMRSLPRIVADTKIDSEVDVVLLRDGKEKSIGVKVGELEKAEQAGFLGSTVMEEETDSYGTEIGPLGLAVEPVTEELREEYGVGEDVAKGLVIVEVDEGSQAQTKGLMAGDVIVEVNQKQVATAKEIEKAVESAQKQGRGSVLLLISRNGDVRFVALKIEKEGE